MSSGYSLETAIFYMSVSALFGTRGAFGWGWLNQRIGVKKAIMTYTVWWIVAIVVNLFADNVYVVDFAADDWLQPARRNELKYCTDCDKIPPPSLYPCNRYRSSDPIHYPLFRIFDSRFRIGLSGRIYRCIPFIGSGRCRHLLPFSSQMSRLSMNTTFN